MRSDVTSREFLRVGGGYHAPSEGASPAGGLDIDNAGNLATDGDAAVDGALTAGNVYCAGDAAIEGNLSAADIRFTGDLEAGTGGCNKLWSRFVGGTEFLRGDGVAAAYVAYNANSVCLPVIKLPANAIHQAGFSMALPSDYDGGPLTFRVFWSATDGTAGTVKWNLRPNTHQDGESLDVATGSGSQDVTDAFQGLKVLHVASGTNTPGFATGGDKLLTVLLQRRATDTEDTFDGEAHLIGVEVGY